MSPKTLRNLLSAAGILVLGLVVTVVLVKTANRPKRQAPPPSQPVVAVHEVTPDAEPVLVHGFGSVTAKRSVEIVPEVRGRVVAKSAHLEPGAYIRSGEMLLRIDDTDYVLAAAQARANVAQAEVSLAQAEEEASVARREWDQMGTGGEPTALVLREPQLNLARAGLEAAKAALSQAELNLARCTISAPFDGRVLVADVDEGDFLAAGVVVGSMYATDMAEVTVPVADDDLAWITVGHRGEGGVPVDVVAEFAGARHHWQGRAVRLGGAVDQRSRLVPVIVEIPDPYRREGDRPALVEGMFVEVVFASPPPAGAVVVPRSALRPGDQAWVVDAEGRLRIRDVTVARAGVDQAVVTAGLGAGERVCVSNLQYVTDGMPVRVAGEGPGRVAGGAGQDNAGAAAAKDGDR
ncbi:MAG TPA: efflux RND transporter periplasmic adaptor subunit [Candidatus Krumholzibacteria bacterium]|nr:efflux RND transporter periplasmic adaptor subunit [Candidatus Krumholzibacteria bacterium]